MKREVIDCDGCPKKDIKPAVKVDLWVGTSSCEVEGRTYQDYSQPDLCDSCLNKLVLFLRNGVEQTEQKEWAKKNYPKARIV